MPHQSTCEHCNEPFAYTRGKGRFCSRTCWRAYESAHQFTCTCEACGVVFPCRRTANRQFCSRTCSVPNQVGGVPPPRAAKSLADRFWLKVQQCDGCWEWSGSRDRNGYGRISSGPAPATPLLTHRVSWELHYGPIPEGIGVLHRCDNPPCVNPAHLFPGTPADNNRDKDAKGRANTPNGRRCRTARLTEADIVEIRRLYAIDSLSQFELGRRFGVSQSNISAIVLGKTWKHVV
jgi:hypothetical protein